MTSQKKSKHHQMGLLGSNDLRGGPHLYSPDTLTENWFDQRLAPEYLPIRERLKLGKPPPPRINYFPQEEGEKELQAFNAKNRTQVGVMVDIRKQRRNPIPPWLPPDPYTGHPPIPDLYETMYECTLGDPKWKNAPIPVGKNWLNYQTIPEHEQMVTEYRTSFKNPRSVPLPLSPRTGYAQGQAGATALRSENGALSSYAHALPPAQVRHSYDVSTNEHSVNRVPRDRLIPTSTLGIPPYFQRDA